MQQTLGKRIRNLRTEAKMTQGALGTKLNVLKQQVYSYEISKNIPPIIKLQKICKIFNVDIGWLITGKE